jgi:hypothetical protein
LFKNFITLFHCDEHSDEEEFINLKLKNEKLNLEIEKIKTESAIIKMFIEDNEY